MGAGDRKQEAVVHPSLYLGRVSRAKVTQSALRTPECLRIQIGRDRAAENLIKVKVGTGTEKRPEEVKILPEVASQKWIYGCFSVSSDFSGFSNLFYCVYAFVCFFPDF